MILRSDKENLPRAALTAYRGVAKTCHRGKLSVQSNDELKKSNENRQQSDKNGSFCEAELPRGRSGPSFGFRGVRISTHPSCPGKALI